MKRKVLRWLGGSTGVAIAATLLLESGLLFSQNKSARAAAKMDVEAAKTEQLGEAMGSGSKPAAQSLGSQTLISQTLISQALISQSDAAPASGAPTSSAPAPTAPTGDGGLTPAPTLSPGSRFDGSLSPSTPMSPSMSPSLSPSASPSLSPQPASPSLFSPSPRRRQRGRRSRSTVPPLFNPLRPRGGSPQPSRIFTPVDPQEEDIPQIPTDPLPLPEELQPDAQLEREDARYDPNGRYLRRATRLGSGMFTSTGHLVQGRITLLSSRGRDLVEFNRGFMSDSGAAGIEPMVILHRDAIPRDFDRREDYVILDRLQQYSGSQTYAIPPDVNLAEYQSLAIWNPRSRTTYGYVTLP